MEAVGEHPESKQQSWDVNPGTWLQSPCSSPFHGPYRGPELQWRGRGRAKTKVVVQLLVKEVKVAQSRLTLCNLMEFSRPA